MTLSTNQLIWPIIITIYSGYKGYRLYNL